MAQVFRTAKDSPYEVELAGVGRMAGSGKGGIPVERAAEHIAELQDDSGQPLQGSKLVSAAKKFAEDRGLAIENAKDVDSEALRVEGGAFPVGPTIEELSAESVARERAQVPAEANALQPEPEVPEVEPPAPRDFPLSTTPPQED